VSKCPRINFGELECQRVVLSVTWLVSWFVDQLSIKHIDDHVDCRDEDGDGKIL